MAPRSSDQGYERYLLGGERVVVALHRHWAMVARPVAAWVLALVVATWVDLSVPAGGQVFSTAVWWLWLGLTAWTAWQVLDWRREWFVATDKRLILTQGLVTKNVAMMPLTKVTDLSYVRTLPGRVVGYGMFVLESAGQDQALREVSWIPQPDVTYRAICAELFGSPDDDARRPDTDPARPDAVDQWAAPWLTEEPDEPWAPDEDEAELPLPSAVVERDVSRAIPVTTAPGPISSDEHRPDASHELYEPWSPDPTRAGDPYDSGSADDPDGESLYSSDDIARRQRDDDTGPLSRYED